VWAATIAPLAALVVFIAVNGATGKPHRQGVDVVPEFRLATSSGGVVDRAVALGEGDTLFYFSMGVGCDGCFAQIPEIVPGLEARGIRLVPVMVDPPSVVATEAQRWGVEIPILIDADLSLSRAMGMVGVYGHSNSPSHSFALVRNGTVEWVRHYAEMFVPSEVFFSELEDA
jgi:peroxiredoxin